MTIDQVAWDNSRAAYYNLTQAIADVSTEHRTIESGSTNQQLWVALFASMEKMADAMHAYRDARTASQPSAHHHPIDRTNPDALKHCPFCRAVPNAETGGVNHSNDCWLTLYYRDGQRGDHVAAAWNTRAPDMCPKCGATEPRVVSCGACGCHLDEEIPTRVGSMQAAQVNEGHPDFIHPSLPSLAACPEAEVVVDADSIRAVETSRDAAKTLNKYQRVLYRITGGRPMTNVGYAFSDAVSGQPVYHFIDKLGRHWLAHGQWSSFFRVPTTHPTEGMP